MIKKCPFCDKIVGKDPHIYSCNKKTTEDRKEIKFLFISKNFPKISIEKNIKEEYKDKSLVDIKNDFGIDFKSILFLLDYYKIKKRNISDSSKIITTKKYKKTCLEKYGVDNASKSLEIKMKKNETFLKNYGVDNIFKDEKFKKWIFENNFAWNNLTIEENKNRVEKQTKSIKKYWNNLSDEQKNRTYHHGGSSNLESKISESLNNLSISYTTQFPLNGKLFDFKLSNTKILMEINGDYWHCNPSKYRIDEKVNFPYGTTEVSSVWKKDNIKKELAEKDGYQVIYIWEKEINESDNIENLILNKLKLKPK